MTIFRKFTASLMLVALIAPVSAMTASQTIKKEVVEVNAEGVEEIRYEPAELVTPGERVVYTVNFENNLDKPETDLVLTMPIPAEVDYIGGTASLEGAVVTFSADGKSFAKRDNVRVAGLNGQLIRATDEDITHIRWVIAGPIVPGEKGAISFKGVLK